MKRVYSMAALETIARNILKNYDEALINGQPQAIPIEKIIECRYRLDMEYHYLHQESLLLGCTAFNNTLLPIYNTDIGQNELIFVTGGTIVIDSGLLQSGTEGRLRFTLAHELAHWIIHQELREGKGKAAYKTSFEENSRTERQANILATALLMPKGQVKRAFYNLRSAGGDHTRELAKLFNVSKQAMSIFLQDHRLN